MCACDVTIGRQWRIFQVFQRRSCPDSLQNRFLEIETKLDCQKGAAEELWSIFDTDGDGKLSFQEAQHLAKFDFAYESSEKGKYESFNQACCENMTRARSRSLYMQHDLAQVAWPCPSCLCRFLECCSNVPINAIAHMTDQLRRMRPCNCSEAHSDG